MESIIYKQCSNATNIYLDSVNPDKTPARVLLSTFHRICPGGGGGGGGVL